MNKVIPDLVVGSQSNPLRDGSVHLGPMGKCALESKGLVSTLKHTDSMKCQLQSFLDTQLHYL